MISRTFRLQSTFATRFNRFGLRGHGAVAFEDSHTGSLAATRADVWSVAAPDEATAHQDFTHINWLVASLAEVNLAALHARFGRP